ncbi:MAG: hypothetical protein JNM45_08015 [Rhizobiales bacterium]|nr:hypothetical protein [Hyphomicrobiales bacterium]
MTHAWTGEERRRETRFRVQKPALFVFDGSSRTEQCLILEQSASGVRILCSPIFRFPAEGTSIVFISEKLLQPVQTVWRLGCHAGLSFTGEAYHVFDQPAFDVDVQLPLEDWLGIAPVR